MNKTKSLWESVSEYLDDLVKRVEALEARASYDPSQEGK